MPRNRTAVVSSVNVNVDALLTKIDADILSIVHAAFPGELVNNSSERTSRLEELAKSRREIVALAASLTKEIQAIKVTPDPEPPTAADGLA